MEEGQTIEAASLAAAEPALAEVAAGRGTAPRTLRTAPSGVASRSAGICAPYGQDRAAGDQGRDARVLINAR